MLYFAQVYLDNCKASSDHLRALSAGGLKALTIGRLQYSQLRGFYMLMSQNYAETARSV